MPSSISNRLLSSARLSRAIPLTPRPHSRRLPLAFPVLPSRSASTTARNPLPRKAARRISQSRLPGDVPSRGLHCSAACLHGDITRPAPGTGIKLHFKDSKGTLIKTIEGNEGDDILSLAHEHDIDLEGACEGSVACSTCHVILSPEHYDLLPEPSDDENDMLDMAFGLTDTSRLGCQVELTREMDGMTATLPSATRNMFVDGKKPTHH
ncbi:ferredoxin [Leucogyrophana mollusca]|uniref:Ferredoxin n=1 Tax=Leucogyrophana mollusca TaxID=85980 RepID=A0ACB8BWR7_9AGAM|nr:ferredoxin [Leucogyrophana mollusca]